MRTKRIITVSLLVATLFGIGVSLPATAEWHPAQENKNPAPKERPRRESRSERMARELNLTKDQQEKIDAALKEQTTRLDAIQADFREKRKKLHEETDQKILSVMNAEQKTKYKENRQQRLFQKAADFSKNRSDQNKPKKP